MANEAKYNESAGVNKKNKKKLKKNKKKEKRNKKEPKKEKTL